MSPSHFLYPRYSLPPRVILGLTRDLLLRRHRSFRKDARESISKLVPPLNFLGSEHVPQVGPCLVVFNHYSRPGFNAWWNALAIAAQLPMEVHFVMTDELTFPGKWYAPVGSRLSHWALKRGAKVYGFTGMPPMPPREEDVVARAHSVRKVLSFVERTENPVVCLAPEGGDMPGGRVSLPPPGAGRFMLRLATKGLKMVPVGIWEQDGYLCLNFGHPFELSIPPGTAPDAGDRLAARQVMEKIAVLLPQHFRGEFQ